jgi:hypothetical protein
MHVLCGLVRAGRREGGKETGEREEGGRVDERERE